MYNELEYDLVELDLPNIIYAHRKGGASRVKTETHPFLAPLLVKLAKARPKWKLVGTNYNVRPDNVVWANAFTVFEGNEELGTVRKDYNHGTGSDCFAIDNKRMADNDQFRILIGGTGTNSGYVEIATADDGTEPIYVDRLTELLRYPNDYETFQDLVANSTGYKLITGGRCVWAQMLDMGANQGKPYQLHNLPYQEVNIIASTNMFPIVEEGYMIPVLSDALFPKQQVLHDKYQNYDWDINGSHLYGMSPLKAALRRLSRSNSAIKASAAMLENQGVKGVLYVDDPRVMNGGVDVADTRKQVEAIKRTDFRI